MFNVHVWAYSVLLYTVSVGFGIAYSELRAMREPYTRDKQSGRFPRFFFIFLWILKTYGAWESTVKNNIITE